MLIGADLPSSGTCGWRAWPGRISAAPTWPGRNCAGGLFVTQSQLHARTGRTGDAPLATAPPAGPLARVARGTPPGRRRSKRSETDATGLAHCAHIANRGEHHAHQREPDRQRVHRFIEAKKHWIAPLRDSWIAILMVLGGLFLWYWNPTSSGGEEIISGGRPLLDARRDGPVRGG